MDMRGDPEIFEHSTQVALRLARPVGGRGVEPIDALLNRFLDDHPLLIAIVANHQRGDRPGAERKRRDLKSRFTQRPILHVGSVAKLVFDVCGAIHVRIDFNVSARHELSMNRLPCISRSSTELDDWMTYVAALSD